KGAHVAAARVERSAAVRVVAGVDGGRRGLETIEGIGPGLNVRELRIVRDVVADQLMSEAELGEVVVADVVVKIVVADDRAADVVDDADGGAARGDDVVPDLAGRAPLRADPDGRV